MKKFVRSILLALAMIASVGVSLVVNAPAASAATGQNIADTANSQLGNHCQPYNGCYTEWCSIFAKWVWTQNGIQYTNELDARAITFYWYGQTHATLTSTPHVGDAVVFKWSGTWDGTWADHVAIITAVNGSTITTVGGNEGGYADNYATWVNQSQYSVSNPAVKAFIRPVGIDEGMTSAISAPLIPDGNNLRYFHRNQQTSTLTYRARVGQTWGTSSLGGSITGEPSAHSEGSIIRIFATGTDGHLKYFAYANGQWGTSDLGGSITGNPTAHTIGDAVRVFARGTDGHLKYFAYANGQWNTYDLGGSITGSPTAQTIGPDVRVFATGTDAHLKYFAYANGQWNTYDLGGSITGSPTAQSIGTIVRVFARGTDGHLKYFAYANGQWGTSDLGGSITGDPTALTTPDGQVHVIAKNASGQPVYYWWNGTGWSITTLT